MQEVRTFGHVYNVHNFHLQFLLHIFGWIQLASSLYQWYTKAVDGLPTLCGKTV